MEKTLDHHRSHHRFSTSPSLLRFPLRLSIMHTPTLSSLPLRSCSRRQRPWPRRTRLAGAAKRADRQHRRRRRHCHLRLVKPLPPLPRHRLTSLLLRPPSGPERARGSACARRGGDRAAGAGPGRSSFLKFFLFFFRESDRGSARHRSFFFRERKKMSRKVEFFLPLFSSSSLPLAPCSLSLRRSETPPAPPLPLSLALSRPRSAAMGACLSMPPTGGGGGG